MAQGSGGVSGPSFSQVENSLRNVALQYASIVSLQTQLQAGLNAWRELERELALARAAAGGTANDFRDMEKAARAFALTSTYSAGQVAGAFYNLASAGLSVKETLEAATGVVLLAQATMTDLAEASDMTASAMSQFNLTAQESYRVSNLFVAATNNSLATVPKLAYALRQVGPIASQAGLSIEETTAALSKLFDAGLRGEQAGTALRNSISRIMSPVGEARQVLQALGVSVYDTSGQMRNMIDVFQELSAKNLSVNQASAIVGVEASAGFLSLLKELKSSGGGAENELRKLQAAITNTDSAYRQSVVQLNTLDGAIFRAQNNFADMRIQLGQLLTPAMVKFADLIENLNTLLSSTSDESKLTAASWLAMVASVGLLVYGLSRVDTVITSMGKNLALTKAAFSDLQVYGNRAFIGTAEGAIGTVSAIGRMTTGLLGIAGSLVGIGLVVAGLWEMRNAAKAAADEAERVRAAKVTENLYADYANQQVASGKKTETQAKDFTTTPVDVGALARQFANIQKLQGGQDAFVAMRETSAFVQTAGELLKLQDERVKALETNLKGAQQSWTKLAQTTERLESAGTVSGMLSARFAVNARALDSISQSSYPNDPAKRDELARNLAAQLVGIDKTLIAATDQNAKQVIANWLATKNRIIQQAQGISEFDKSSLINQNNTLAKSLNQTDPFGVATWARLQGEQATKLAGDLAKSGYEQSAGVGNVADALANSTQKAQNDLVTKVKQNLELSDTQMQGKIIELKTDRDNIAAMQAQAISDLGGPAFTERLAKGLSDFVVTAISKDQSLTSQQTEQLKKLVYSPEVQKIIQQAAKEMPENGKSLREALDGVWTAIEKEKIDTRGFNLHKLQEVSAMYLFDPNEVQLALDKAQVRLEQTLVDLAKLQGDPDAFKKAAAQISHKGQVDQQEIVSSLLKQLGSTKESYGANIIAMLQSDDNARAEFTSNLKKYAANTSDETALNAIIAQLKPRADAKGIETLRAVIKQHAIDMQNAAGQTKIALEQNVKDGARAEAQGTHDDPAEKLLVDLLALPSANDLKLQSDAIYLRAKYMLSDYLNAPLAKVDKAIEEASLDYRQKLAQLYDKFGKVFTGKLAVGVKGVVSDKTMIDAFSGEAIANIFATGKGTVLGTEFTAEMLRTQKGMQQYVDSVISAFSKSVSGSVDAEARVNIARTQLIGMINEISAMQSEVGAKMETLVLEQSKVRAAVNKAVADFQDNQLLSLFQEQVQASMFGNDHPIDIQLALQAQVIQVRLDTRDAIDKVTKEFQDLFAQKGIAVGLTADGQLDFSKVGKANAIGSGTESVATISQALTASTQGRPKGTESDPIVIRTSRTAAAGAIGQAEMPLSRVLEIARAAGLHVNSSQRPTWIKDEVPGGPSSQERLYNKWVAEGKPKDNPTAAPGHSAHENGHALDIQATPGLTLEKIMHIFEEAGIQFQKGIRERGHFHIQFGGATEQGAGLSFKPQDNGQVQAPTLSSKLDEADQKFLDAQREIYQQRIALINRIADAQAAFVSDDKNAQIFAYEKIQEFRMAMYDAYQGKVMQGLVAQRQAQLDVYKATYDLANSRIGDVGYNLKDSIVQSRQAQLTMYRAQNALNAQTEIADVRRKIEAYKGELEIKLDAAKTDEDRAALEADIAAANQLEADSIAQINEQLERKNELAENDLELRRQFLQQTADQILARGNTEGSDPKAALDGIKSAVLEFRKSLPSVAETAKNVALTGLNGFSDIIATIITKGTGGIRQMLANMFAAMAQLIAKMLAMYAVMQLISALPGGKALLAVLDATSGGGGLGGRGSIGSGAGLPNVLSNQSAGNIQFSANGGIGYARAFADGGMMAFNAPAMSGLAQILSINQRMLGGVRQGKQPAVSIFGEGDYPEAYIPMVDRRTIPLSFDQNGNPFVPLPSGKRIPVSMNTRKFALGGTNSYDNGIANPYTANAARQAVLSVYDATGPQRGAVQTSANVTQTTNLQMGDIVIQGNASRDDAGAISDEVVKKVMALLAERDREMMMHTLRNRGDVQDEYGVRM